MTAFQAEEEIRNGEHWLNQVAKSNGLDLIKTLDKEALWSLELGEVAIELCEIAADKNQQERNRTLIAKVFPWEKAAVIRAANGRDIETWIRETLIEAAAKTGHLPDPL